MSSSSKRIIIVEEAGFGRVCSALLETAGFTATSVSPPEALCRHLADDIGLVILSYPGGEDALERIQAMDVPVLVLSGHVDMDLMSRLDGCSNLFCMIKPIDYRKFLALVRQVMDGVVADRRGYVIV